jgi:hypothetical protein
MRSSRLIFAVLAAALAATLVAGDVHFALHALPYAGLLLLLLSGRFIGEQRILALRAAPALRLRRGLARRWRPSRPDSVVSLFARTPRSFRGPPAALLTV